MSDIDDLEPIADSFSAGLDISKQKKGVRAFYAKQHKRIITAAKNTVWLPADRAQPSLLHIPCLDRPITNYIED